MNLRQTITARFILCVIVFTAIMLAYFLSDYPVWCYLLCALAFIGCILIVVIQLLFWRCPHCGHSFFGQREIGDYCTYCGKYLY